MRLTRAVKALLIACVAMFLVQQTADRWFGGDLLGWLGLIPSAFLGKHFVWQILTYSFLHADPMHLFLNLMVLAFIGGEIEAVWGTKRFLRYYFFCTASAGLLYVLLQLFWKEYLPPMVGASGAIYGLLVAYGILFGERVLLFMLLFPMKAKHFIWILAALELMTSVFGQNSNLGGVAHLGGMAAGFLYLYVKASWKVAQRSRQMKDWAGGKKKKKSKASDHLKLVINNDPDDPKTWH